MKRKGFTLIELLAVIVVLAIIALIATPIVLNLIENARKGAAEQSAVAYINAIENYMVLSLLNPDEYPLKLEKGKTYQISENIYEISYDTYSLIPVVYAEEETKDYVEGIYVGDYVYVNGTYPESGVITIGESGIIENATMSIGGYVTECEQKKCKVIGKDSSDIIKVKEVKITDKSITELEVGETLELSATVKPDNATNKKISWLSSNPTIATVENGVVTAKAKGTVTIVAKSESVTDFIDLIIHDDYMPYAVNDDYTSFKKGDAITNYVGYNWHVVSNSNNELTILMDGGQSGTFGTSFTKGMGHKETTSDIYKWSTSKINTYINNEFYNSLPDNLKRHIVEQEICDDSSTDSRGGYLKSQNKGCGSSYVKSKVRLITIDEFTALKTVSGYGSWLTCSTSACGVDNKFKGRWWTMNTSTMNKTYAVAVIGSQANHENYAANVYGIRPVITIEY